MQPLDSPAPQPASAPPPTRCNATTGKGEKCKAYAIRGTQLCRGHSLSREEREQMTAASAAARSAQAEARSDALEAARKGTRVKLGEAVEELGSELVAAYRAALRTGSPEDLRRAQAAEYLLSRVYGRPAQPTRDETPTVASALSELEALSLEELSALARSLPTHPEAA
jgi:hypothetical protein